MSALPMSQPFRSITWERENRTDEDFHEAVQREALTLATQMRLSIDALGWQNVADIFGETNQFTHDDLSSAAALARLMYVQNPLIRRSVELQKLYVWALGFDFRYNNPAIQEVVDAFLEDPKNKAELSKNALIDKEVNLQLTGNLFFLYYIKKETGRVRIRSLNHNHITAIYTNPKDPKEVWFYKRKVVVGNKTTYVWHPDWKFKPQRRARPNPIGGQDETVDWTTPMSHIKDGGFDDVSFGWPSIYPSLAWAKAVKVFLENWSTIMEAHAQVAMQLTAADKSSVAVAKSKFQTAATPGTIGERKVGQFAAFSGGMELKAVKTAGATTGPDEGDPLMLMVAAGAGWPLTFYGRTDLGSMATAQTLDRPSELRMVMRQGQWAEWLLDIVDFVVDWAVIANNGPLRNIGATYITELDDVDNTYRNVIRMPKGVDRRVQMKFPDILEPNATERIRSLVMGVTMMGKPMTSVIPDARFIARTMLEAMGVKPDLIETYINQWYPEGQAMVDPQDLNPEPATGLAPSGDEEDA
jgi:hypothetical protein